jgi:hypothetical protein
MALDDKQRDAILAVVVEQPNSSLPQSIDMLRPGNEVRFARARPTREPLNPACDAVLGFVVEGEKCPLEPLERFDLGVGAQSPNSA